MARSRWRGSWLPFLSLIFLLVGCVAGLPDPAGAVRTGRRLMQLSVGKTLATPSDCSQWLPERRVYLEGQAWFTR